MAHTFDLLASVAGLVLVIVLAAAGGLLLWGHSFTDSQVSTQLSAQKIVFPTTGSKLAALVSTVFKGTTPIGVIALWGAIVSSAGAGLLLILSGLGFMHARWTSATAEVLLGRHPEKTAATAS